MPPVYTSWKKQPDPFPDFQISSETKSANKLGMCIVTNFTRIGLSIIGTFGQRNGKLMPFKRCQPTVIFMVVKKCPYSYIQHLWNDENINGCISTL